MTGGTPAGTTYGRAGRRLVRPRPRAGRLSGVGPCSSSVRWDRSALASVCGRWEGAGDPSPEVGRCLLLGMPAGGEAEVLSVTVGLIRVTPLPAQHVTARCQSRRGRLSVGMDLGAQGAGLVVDGAVHALVAHPAAAACPGARAAGAAWSAGWTRQPPPSRSRRAPCRDVDQLAVVEPLVAGSRSGEGGTAVVHPHDRACPPTTGSAVRMVGCRRPTLCDDGAGGGT